MKHGARTAILNILTAIHKQCDPLFQCGAWVRMEVEEQELRIIVRDRHTNIEYPIELDDDDNFSDPTELIAFVLNHVKTEQIRLDEKTLTLNRIMAKGYNEIDLLHSLINLAELWDVELDDRDGVTLDIAIPRLYQHSLMDSKIVEDN